MNQDDLEERTRGEFGAHVYRSLADLPSSQRFSGEQLEVIYGMAYAHVVQKQYRQALPIFSFLAQYGPTRKHYWAGMALCLNMIGRHEEAESIYGLNDLLFPASPDSALHMAECQIAAGKLAQAHETLTAVLRRAQSDASHGSLCQRAQALMKLTGSMAAAA